LTDSRSSASRHPFFASDRPLIFAHRGGAGLAPENTIAAFDCGLAHGADGIELDVRLSADGVVVVHHDHTLERTTDLRGPVERRTADELARADAGVRFPQTGAATSAANDDRSAFGIPTLAAVLGRYRDCRIIVEMKQSRVELAAGVVDAIRKAGAADRVCVGSFSYSALRKVRDMEPAIATSASREEVRWALYRSWVNWSPGRRRYQGFQVPEWAGSTRVVSPRFVECARRAGFGVQVWTVDAPEDARRLIEWGVHAIITDRPDRVVKEVKR
jgi:glycerophosphoryl diester phosphodiesterase